MHGGDGGVDPRGVRFGTPSNEGSAGQSDPGPELLSPGDHSTDVIGPPVIPMTIKLVRDLDILMLEDSHTEFQLAQEALTESGARAKLRQARNRDEALRKVLQARPHLLLLDLGLPGDHGLSVLSDFRSRPETRSIPVIVLSGSIEPEDVQVSYFAGASAYLRKPADLDLYADLFKSLASFWGNHAEF